MKKYQFKFKKIWKIKKFKEDIKKNDFQKAKSDLERKANELQSLKNELEAQKRRFITLNQKGTKAAEIAIHGTYINDLIKDIKIKKHELNYIAKLVNEKQKQLSKAIKERKVYDKLNERHYDKFKEETKRVYQKRLDNNAIISYSQKGRGING